MSLAVNLFVPLAVEMAFPEIAGCAEASALSGSIQTVKPFHMSPFLPNPVAWGLTNALLPPP